MEEGRYKHGMDGEGQGKLYGDKLDFKISVRIVISGIFIGR